MHQGMKHPPEHRPGPVEADATEDMARKAALCANVLDEARKLALNGSLGALLNQLVQRAGELLEDIDEMLDALHPAVGKRPLAAATALHREFEDVQATMLMQKRIRSFKPKALKSR